MSFNLQQYLSLNWTWYCGSFPASCCRRKQCEILPASGVLRVSCTVIIRQKVPAPPSLLTSSCQYYAFFMFMLEKSKIKGRVRGLQTASVLRHLILLKSSQDVVGVQQLRAASFLIWVQSANPTLFESSTNCHGHPIWRWPTERRTKQRFIEKSCWCVCQGWTPSLVHKQRTFSYMEKPTLTLTPALMLANPSCWEMFN